MKSTFVTTIVLLLFVNSFHANYTESRFYRNCNNFEYPVDISFSGRLDKIPEMGHSYEATYDSKNNFRLVSVKHYFNGKHLPVYNFSPSDYYGDLIEYSLVSMIVLNYDEKNRVSSIEMKNLKNELCHNKWGTAKYTYEYENQSSFDCNEYRYYIDYSDNQKLNKKPISLQIHEQFHLEHQLVENKFWQRKNWVVGVDNYYKEYLLFHPNGEPKNVRQMRCNKINYKLDLGASGYLEHIYNEDAIQIEVNTFSSDSKLYGTTAKRITSVVKGSSFYTCKTLAYTSENRYNGNSWNNQHEEFDLTFLPVKSFGIDSSGVESFYYDEYSNGYIRSRQIVKEDDVKTRSNELNLNKAVVAVKKTFFHSMPDEGTKKGAFLITGDTILVEKSQNNFVYSTFTNEYNGKVTSGWLKMNELQIIQTKSFNGYIVTDSMINYKNVLKEAALEKRYYNSDGLLQKVTRKNQKNEVYEDKYVPFKEEYTYFWSEKGLGVLDSVVQINSFKKITNPLEDSIETIRTKYDELGFFSEKETRIKDLENWIEYKNFRPNSFLTEERNPYNSTKKYSLIEGSNFYTEIDSTFSYDDLSTVEKKTFERIGKNFFPVEEVNLKSDYETETMVGDYYPYKFSLYNERKNFTKSKRKFDKNGRLVKVQYFIQNGDSLEIYYTFKDMPNDYFSYDNYSIKPSEIELRRNNIITSDNNGIQKFFFEYDKNLNKTMEYCKKEDGSIIQSGGYGYLDYFFSSKMQDQLTENLIIPKLEYNQNKLVSKVSFWKNDLKSIAYDNAGIHKYEFTYDNNLNAFSIIAKDENTNQRKDDNWGVSEKCYFRDIYGNETHSLTKNKKGEILENELTIKEYSGNSYGDDNKLISEKYFKVENNILIKVAKDGFHQTILKVINSPEGKKIVIKSYKDEEGKLVKRNGVSQIRVVTDPYDWYRDTLAISYYNDKGYVSEEKRFENLADSVFFEGKGWFKDALMEMTKETFPNLSTGFKKERIYYNSKGKPTNNEFGYARSIICDSMPFYKYKKYYSENGNLAFNGDTKKQYFIKEESPKEFVTKQYFLNDNSQIIKNQLGVPTVLSKKYWIKGVKVIENTNFDAKGNKKICDKNGVHKVVYYINNSFYDVVDDTLAFICFDKKNKVVSNELGSFVNLFGDRFYNSPSYNSTSYDLDSAVIVETPQGSLLLDTVELQKSYSKFKFIYTGNGCYIDKNLKLIQEGTNKEFKLIKSVGVPMSKDTYSALNETAKEIDKNGNITFYLYFEPLPKKKANYKFVENVYSESAWNAPSFNISIPEK